MDSSLDRFEPANIQAAMRRALEESPQAPIVREGEFEGEDLFMQDVSSFRFCDCRFRSADLRGTQFDPEKVVRCDFEEASRLPTDHAIPGWHLLDGKLRRSEGGLENQIDGQGIARRSELPPVSTEDLGNGVIHVNAADGLPGKVDDLLRAFSETLSARIVIIDSKYATGWVAIHVADPNTQPYLGDMLAQQMSLSGIQCWPIFVDSPDRALPDSSAYSCGSQFGIRVLQGSKSAAIEAVLGLLDRE
jgi:hypothetical protein